jgi:hypothetical protein
MTEVDLADLRRARSLLEHPGIAIRVSNLVGKPVERAIAVLPQRAQELVASATRSALDKALGLALRTLDGSAAAAPARWRHRGMVWASGAVGGAFGLAGLPFELPVSTMVMLRSIADHARSHGEDLATPEARLNCLLVFALGGASRSDDASETGYFGVRAALARAVSEAAEYLAGRTAARSAAEKGAPVLVRLVASLAARFQVPVTEKILMQAVPLIGAASGALINDLFITHFQDVAWGHFALRRLERKYGAEEVRAAYEALEG